jgi:AraC family transcriptional regulator
VDTLYPVSHPTLEEWYSKPVVSVLNSSESLGWENLILRYNQLYPALEPQPLPHSDRYALILLLEGPTRMQAKIPSDKDFDEIFLPGAIQLIPSHLEGISSWDSASTAAFLEMTPQFIRQLMEDTFRGDPHQMQLAPNINFHDPLMRTLIEKLCHELHNSSPLGSLYAESITRLLTLHLLQKHAKLTEISTPKHHRLSTEQKRTLIEYIEVQLGGKITVEKMAALLHISVSHFERIFHATFDIPPYRYVIERRVERAKLLLSTNPSHTLTLQAIAELCGFTNQSHLNRHFTRIVGVSPARFRNSKH